MKKTILALTIPALFATSASAVTVYSDEGAQVDIYGRIQYDAGSFDHDGADREKFGGDGSARLGTNVKYDLNNDVALIGKLEWQVAAESSDGSKFDSRYAWAGFRFQDTTDLTFGKSENPFVQLSDITDIFELFGAAAYSHSWRIDDQVRVSYADQGIDLRAAYAFNDQNRTREDLDAAEERAQNQYSLSAGYATPFGLGLVAAYEKQNVKTGPLAAEGDFDMWGVGANYSIDGFYFGTVYGHTSQDVVGGSDADTRYWEIVGAYNVDAWTLRAGYNYEKDRKGDNKKTHVNEYVLGAAYALNPKTKLYAEYNLQRAKTGGERKDDLYGVGIQYNF
ncbi:porin [Zobellella sp. DQSA1]|uniref:porin n=1 Tax=Zobellella sp. DQSA1 TaxID=3342386 RepID=UPI0035C19CBC